MVNNLRLYNRRILEGVIASLACFLLASGTARAAGTPAGTVIVNTVTVNYQKAGVPQPALTRTTGFAVDRVINVTVTKNADATVQQGSTNHALLFLVSNTSNTSVRYDLQAVSSVTNTWTMNNVRIYRDTNNNSAWDAGDTQYADAATYGDIPVDGALRVMIVADTPAGVAAGQTASYDLAARAVDAGTLNASVLTAGPDTAGIDTVFVDSAGSAAGDGARDGKHSAGGTYSVDGAVSPVLTMTKTVAAILDQWGGNQPIPGATLRYEITAKANGAANNVVVSDPLPANTAYIPNTLKLNTTALTDSADADAGDVGDTTADTITVKLGNMTGASLTQTITFEVKIK